MDRRSIIKNAGLAGVLAAGLAPAVHAQTSLRWRLASAFPKSLDTLFGVNDIFAAKVRELTDGKFQISTHAAGELMPAFGVLDGVSNGTVEMANTAPYYHFGKDPTFALDCAIPFGLNARQIDLIAGATPKRDYYLVSRDGCRMFELGLGPAALAFVERRARKITSPWIVWS